jgi:hypothetical protein
MLRNTTLRRWLWNVGLFYAVLLGIGVVAGVIGALGGDGVITGTDATVVHIDSVTGATTVETQGADVEPGRLVFYPLLLLYLGTLYVLPVVLAGLAVAEILARIGFTLITLRKVAVVAALLLALIAVTGTDAGLITLCALGIAAYCLLVRLPSEAYQARGMWPGARA